VWTSTDEEEKSVQEAMAALSRGEEGSTNKVLMMLCVLFLKQTHRENRMEGKRQEAKPVSVSLLHPDAGMHPSTRSSTQSSLSGNRLNSQGEGHVFKKYGREEEQPWMQHKRGEKETGQEYLAEQTEATVEAAGEAEQKERKKLNLIIRGACQETEEEDAFKRKAHNIEQVVMIAKIKCPEYKEEEVREMILQVKREGAFNPEQKFCPMKVVL
jgi:hypothetical protein